MGALGGLSDEEILARLLALNQRTFASLRRHRNYRLLWLGQTGHSATLWMDQVARAVLILNLTDSPLMPMSARYQGLPVPSSTRTRQTTDSLRLNWLASTQAGPVSPA